MRGLGLVHEFRMEGTIWKLINVSVCNLFPFSLVSFHYKCVSECVNTNCVCTLKPCTHTKLHRWCSSSRILMVVLYGSGESFKIQVALHSPSSLIRCCLFLLLSISKLKSPHSSRGGKEMVWRSVKRTASITLSPRDSLEPTLTVEALLVVRSKWGDENSCICRCSMRPFQIAWRNCSGIFRVAKSSME